MRVDYKQLATLMEHDKDKPEYLSKILKEVFTHQENLDTLSNFCFPEYTTAPSADFHKEVYEWLFNPEDGALGAPRGHAKSTIVGLFFIVFCIVNRLEQYIVYVSSNYTKTVQFLDPIRTELKYNKRLRWVYGDLAYGKVKDESGRDREDCFDVSGGRVEAVSFDQNLRGFKYLNKRPTLIVLDDIEDDERVLNPVLRVKDANKLNKIIIPSLDPETGKIKFIGTILHWDSLLVKKIRLYNGKIYKACDEDLNNILWPEYWTKELLFKKRRSMGRVSFACEFLHDPIESESSLIKREWMIKCCDEKLSYEEACVNKYDFKVQGVDFAFSDRVVADKSAFVGVGKDADRYTIISCVTKKGMSITEQFDYIEYLTGIYGFEDNALEENSIRSMSKELKNYSFPFTLFWTAASDVAHRNKYEVEFDDKRHTVGKMAMIKRLATQFENEMIVLPFKTEFDKTVSNAIWMSVVLTRWLMVSLLRLVFMVIFLSLLVLRWSVVRWSLSSLLEGC